MAVVTAGRRGSWLGQPPQTTQFVPGTPRVELVQEADLLLDRLGDRRPAADDLDDPLLALLAEFAADLDVEALPAEETRSAVSRAGVWPLRQDLHRLDDERLPAGLGDDLDAEVATTRGPVTELFRVPSEAVQARDVGISRAETRRLERRQQRSGGMAALVSPPRVLGVRVLPTVAVASAVVVLSMGGAAALSSGETLNPVVAVSRKVIEITRPDPATPSTNPPREADAGVGAGVGGAVRIAPSASEPAGVLPGSPAEEAGLAPLLTPTTVGAGSKASEDGGQSDGTASTTDTLPAPVETSAPGSASASHHPLPLPAAPTSAPAAATTELVAQSSSSAQTTTSAPAVSQSSAKPGNPSPPGQVKKSSKA